MMITREHEDVWPRYLESVEAEHRRCIESAEAERSRRQCRTIYWICAVAWLAVWFVLGLN